MMSTNENIVVTVAVQIQLELREEVINRFDRILSVVGLVTELGNSRCHVICEYK